MNLGICKLALKFTCRGYCRFTTYSIQKSKEREARHVEPEKKLADHESVRTNSTESIREEYDTCKSGHDELYDYFTAGVIMRSKSS